VELPTPQPGPGRVRIGGPRGDATGLRVATSQKRLALTRSAARLRPEPLSHETARARKTLTDVATRARPALTRRLEERRRALEGQAKLLETLSHQATLARGFVMVRSETGTLVRSAAAARRESALSLTFADGDVQATPNETGNTPQTRKPAKPKRAATKDPSGPQGSLF